MLKVIGPGRGARLATLLVAGSTVLSACSTPGATGSPSGSPSAQPTVGSAPPGASSSPTAADFSGRTIVVRSSGGALAEAERKAYFDPFQEATGATVQVVEVGQEDTAALLKAQIDSGNREWDMITGMSLIDGTFLATEQLVEELDFDQIPGIAKLAPGTYFDHGVANEIDAVVFSYSQADGIAPLSNGAADFFNPDVKGDRGGPPGGENAVIGCLIALAADGVPADQLVPIDMDRCLSVWDRIKPQMTLFWQSGSEMAQAMIDGTIDYCMCYDGRVLQATRTNDDWTFTYEGGLRVNSYMQVVKGTPNLDMALALIDFTTDAQRQAVFIESLGYSAPNPEAVEFLPEELKPFVSTTPENQAKLVPLTDQQWLGLQEQREDIYRRWDAWLAS